MNRTICPCGLLDLLQHSLQAIFKLATIFRAGQHRSQIERHHLLVLQLLGYVAGDNALRQTFHDSGLAHAGLADQHRVVLGAARQHLHHAAHFLVATDDGIELALTRQFRQVFRIALQRLVLGLGILVGHLLIAAHRGQPAQNIVVGSAGTGEDLLRRIALQLGHAQQQMLGGNVLVLEVGRLFEGVLQHLRSGIGKVRLGGATAGDFGQLLDLAHCLGLHRRYVQSNALKQGGYDAFVVLQQRCQYVNRLQLGIAVLAGEIVRPLHCLLRLYG